MSERFKQLSGRHQALRELSALQRAQLGAAVGEVERSVEPVDRALNVVRRLAQNPALIMGGVAVLALIGPRRVLNLASRSALILTTARQVLRLSKK